MSDDRWDAVVDPVMGYFDRAGEPISMARWGELYELGVDADGKFGAESYKRVGEDTVGPWWVSTVWLGINHNFGPGDPLIFETMIFNRGDEDGPEGPYHGDCTRYSSEAAALAGHRRAVDDLRACRVPWFVAEDVDY